MFYRTHPEHYDFVVVFTDVPGNLETGTLAFARTVRNATRGIERALLDRGAQRGQAG